MKFKAFSAVVIFATILASSVSFASHKIYATVYYADESYAVVVGEQEQTCNDGTISSGGISAYSKRYYLATCETGAKM